MSDIMIETTEEQEDKRVLSTEEMVDNSSKACRPWQAGMNNLARAYLNEYPPQKTSPDVMRAVTVQVPLPAFMAMFTAMVTVLAIAPKEADKEVA